MRPHRPWPDVPRLLKKRNDFRQLLGDATLAGSVTAFIAWKAFLIIARGSLDGDEKAQVRGLFRATMGADRDLLWIAASAFVTSLRGIAEGTPQSVADWYADQSWARAKRDGQVDWAKRSIGRLSAAFASGQRSAELAEQVADHVYAVRNAVIAHGAVHTNANHFQRVVPRFEHLTNLVTCAGYATRADLPLSTVMEECCVETQ